MYSHYLVYQLSTCLSEFNLSKTFDKFIRNIYIYRKFEGVSYCPGNIIRLISDAVWISNFKFDTMKHKMISIGKV